MDQVPLAPLLLLQADARSNRERAQLALQLAVAAEPIRCQLASIDGAANRAARLAPVSAVAEAAAGGQMGDILEGLVQRRAVEQGELQADRLASYRKLERELHALAVRSSVRLQQEERRKWRLIQKSARDRTRPG